MSKKWWLLLAVMFACVVAACVFLYPAPSELKIAFDRVEKGMSVAEVENLFGQKSFFHEAFSGDNAGVVYVSWHNVNGDQATVKFSDGVATEERTWQASPSTLASHLRRWLPFMK
jgi:hypothetical protein